MYSIIYNTNKESAISFCTYADKRNLHINNLCTISLPIYTGLYKSLEKGNHTKKVEEADKL